MPASWNAFTIPRNSCTWLVVVCPAAYAWWGAKKPIVL